MTVLIVGAGAAGGYIGERLIAAGRDVTFLVHPQTLARLTPGGLRLRLGEDVRTVRVNAVTAADLNDTYDVILVAVRTSAVESAIDDIRSAVGPDSRIVPIMNGIRHLSLLTAAFGAQHVLGAATRLIASMSDDGTIAVVVPGIDMQIGLVDGGDTEGVARTLAELETPDIAVTVRDDVIAAMWEKFAFITSTAALTCLVGEEIGPIARADGGIDLATGFSPKYRRSRPQRVIPSPMPPAPVWTRCSPIRRPRSARLCSATCAPAVPSKSAFSTTSLRTGAPTTSIRRFSTLRWS